MNINTGDIFYHIDSDIGAKYEVLHHANVKCDKINFAHQIVYRSLETGRIYARPIEEFEARFYKKNDSARHLERIEAAAQALVKSWDLLEWKDAKHTAEHMSELRDALQNK